MSLLFKKRMARLVLRLKSLDLRGRLDRVISRRNRRKALLSGLGALLLIGFQNCVRRGDPYAEKQTRSLASQSSFNASTTTTTVQVGMSTTTTTMAGSGTSTTMASTTTMAGATTTTMAQSQDQINRAECAANQNDPVLNAPSLSQATYTSGMGATSGDGTTPQISVTASKSVINASKESTYKCSNYTTMTLSCRVSTAMPITINKAIDLQGVDISGSAASANATAKAALINRAVAFNGCENQALNITNPARTFNLTMNRAGNADQLRCVQGSFYMDVTVRSTVAGSMKTSNIRQVKIDLTDACWGEEKLKAQGGASFSRLANMGSVVATDGIWAAGVAPNEPLGGVVNAGGVYVYQLNNGLWTYHSHIQFADAAADSTVNSVAVKGDTLVIGSAYRNGQGGVHVYKLQGNSWVFSQEITPPRSQSSQLFGYSLAVDATGLYVGAPHYSRTAGDRAGAVYYFSTSGGYYSYSQVLEWSGQDFANRGFGMSLAIDNGIIAVGAPQAINRESYGVGAVSIYQNSGTVNLLTTKSPATSLGGTAGLRFGASVSVLGSRLIVGSPGYNSGGSTGAGAASYYDNYSNANPTKILAGSESGAAYGTSVALVSAGMFIGGPFRDSRGGAVDYFTNSNLNAVAYKLFSSNRTANDGFGWSIASGGNRVIVGARIKADPDQDTGALYAYEMR